MESICERHSITIEQHTPKRRHKAADRIRALALLSLFRCDEHPIREAIAD